MPQMGRYCKAYPAERLREFAGWTVKETTAMADEQGTPGVDILYVQENLCVTRGVFLDEDVVYDTMTPEWEEFCKTNLEFEIPAYARD